MKKAVVFLANGFEEIEALSPVDYLRRAGVEVTTVAVATSSRTVESSHKVSVIADITLDAYLSSGSDLPDVVVAPGGMPGALNLSNTSAVISFINQCFDAGKIVSAICASPALVLSKTKALKGKKWTCYTNMENDGDAEKYASNHIADKPFVTDGNVVTARGAGASEEFAMELVRLLCGQEVFENLKAKALLR